MGWIYKISNDINNKVYIGQTMRPLYYRWSVHKYRANQNYKGHLYSAMRKYGIDHFYIEEIEKCPDSILDRRERYWIQFYNSYGNGYNETLGGQDAKRMYMYEDICECLLSGEDELSVAKKFHCNRKTVYNASISIIGKNPKNIYRDYWKQKAIEYYKEGYSVSSIEKIVPHSNATIRVFLHEANVFIPNRKGEK